MTGGDSEDTLGRSLLDAKLSAPQERDGAVSRAGLIDTARSSGCRVVAVTAPAGYGKSTLLAEWAGGEERPVGWVSLDRLDDDPAALVSLLAAAYGRIAPGHEALTVVTAGLGMSVLGRAAPRLAAAFRAAPEPFVLLVDDLHEVQSPACHDALGVLISGIPDGSQLVAASRSDQPHLARLRASGDAVELGVEDLCLDEAGAQQIFSQAKVELAPELAASITARTEGWPVGLYLAATIARERRAGEALAVAGDDRYVADYLYRESLVHQSGEVRRFLERTAVLDQMSGPLCDAVLQSTGSQARLRELEATNLFLVPLDRRREWYRYHALFREFLLGELRRDDPELIPVLHARAADWYEASDSPALALEHLLSTSDRERCVEMVTALILPSYQSGQVSTTQRWLETLGEDAVANHPPLAVLAGWVAALAGRPAEAERWASVVDAAAFDDASSDGSASFESARSMFRAAMCAHGPEAMLADAAFAVEHEPAWSPWRDIALAVGGEAQLLVGDLDKAQEWFAEASEVAAGRGAGADGFVESESELALLAMDRGRWDQSAEHLRVALSEIDARQMQDYAIAGLAFAGAARLALHRGDVDGATRELTRAMRVRPGGTRALPWLAVRTRLHLAKAYLVLGDLAAVRHLIQEIDDVLLKRPRLGALVDQVTEFRETVVSTAPAAVSGAAPLTPAELRLLPYLQTHLTFQEIGERLFVSRNTVNTHTKAIYRKLGVSSRSDAVEQATAMGLVGG